MNCVVLVFIDGLGLGCAADDVNPLVSGLPLLSERVGPIICGREMPVRSGLWAMTGIDVGMGVPGIPQSATGQSALLTGVNAAEMCGRHISGYPTAALNKVLSNNSLFTEVGLRGRGATFANAFRPDSVRKIASGTYRATATTVAAVGAGVRIRTFTDLARGRAVTHDITGWSVRRSGFAIDEITPEQASENVSRLCADYQFVLVEHFLTDAAGHARDRDMLLQLLAIIDRFMVSLTDMIDGQGTTVVMTSDHGNCEDLSTGKHTQNPVPLIGYGPGAAVLTERCCTIMDVAPVIMSFLRDGSGRK